MNAGNVGRVRPRHWLCPLCKGCLPGDGPDETVCQCGQQGWGAPFPAADLSAAEWETLTVLLTTRSGGLCEVRSPWCLAGRSGDLRGVRHSRHHRLPRGLGGTDNPHIHSLANLLLVCGSGTTGCHGYIERYREWAERRGLLVPRWVDDNGVPVDPADVVVVLHGGRRWLLDPVNPCKTNPRDGVLYDIAA